MGDNLKVDGTVVKAVGNSNFIVEVDHGDTVIATISGKLRTNHIRVAVGDRVTLSVSESDKSRGLITWRHK